MSSVASLDSILVHITDPWVLNKAIRTALPRETREAILSGPLANGEDPLSILEIEAHTLAVLYILSARLSVASDNVPTLSFSYIQTFCRSFHPEQARIASDRVAMLAQGIYHLAEVRRTPARAIQPLHDLLVRYAQSPFHLTPVHQIFFTICLQTNHPTAAIPVLAHPISHFDADLTYNDNLATHYAGGMILTALERWEEAEDWFEICVSASEQQPAAVQMDAFKKLVCVQLILRGKTPARPKHTHGHLVRMLKATPYETFIRNYPEHTDTLRTLLDKERYLFNTDHTLGLLQQALERAPRWQVPMLIGTCPTLSLTEIGKAVGLADEDAVRNIFLSMAESSEISARISAEGIVSSLLMSSDPQSTTSALSVAAAVFRFFQGTWILNRTYVSRRDEYPSGSSTGTAEFMLRPSSPNSSHPYDSTCGTEYLYLETTELTTLTGMMMAGTQRYIYRYDEPHDKIEVFFANRDEAASLSHHFHDVVFAPVAPSTEESTSSPESQRITWKAKAHHLCTPDTYHVSYTFSFRGADLYEWHIAYEVRGPKKDYSMETCYRRRAPSLAAGEERS